MSAPPVRLSDEQRLDWLQLIRCDNVGPRTCRALVNHCGGAAAALEALPHLAKKGGRVLKLATRDEARREFAAAARAGVRFVALGEADYPAPLRMIPDPPPLISLRGAAAALARPMVAIVGSRNASAAGLAMAERLARGLGEAGYVVASGLARGVDARAHRAALGTGTVAVLAGGQNRIYPSDHEALVDEIVAAGGCAVSEMPFDWEARGRDFPRRNRIVSGLSLGTIVVEAARRSGSLITARFANEQGREVFAVPGSPLDPRAEGTNDLLEQGASFCTSVEGVVRALAPLVEKGGAPEQGSLFGEDGPRETVPLWDELDLFGAEAPQADTQFEFNDAPGLASPQAPVEDAAGRVLALLGPVSVDMDDLARAAGLTAAQMRAALTELELTGKAERRDGGLVVLVQGAGERFHP